LIFIIGLIIKIAILDKLGIEVSRDYLHLVSIIYYVGLIGLSLILRNKFTIKTLIRLSIMSFIFKVFYFNVGISDDLLGNIISALSSLLLEIFMYLRAVFILIKEGGSISTVNLLTPGTNGVVYLSSTEGNPLGNNQGGNNSVVNNNTGQVNGLPNNTGQVNGLPNNNSDTASDAGSDAASDAGSEASSVGHVNVSPMGSDDESDNNNNTGQVNVLPNNNAQVNGLPNNNNGQVNGLPNNNNAGEDDNGE